MVIIMDPYPGRWPGYVEPAFQAGSSSALKGSFYQPWVQPLGNKQRHRKPHDGKPMVIIMDPYPGRWPGLVEPALQAGKNKSSALKGSFYQPRVQP